MEIIGIRESGSNALLKFALNNGVNVLKNKNFQNIINNEMGYTINIGPINYIELFNLMMKYPDNPKIHILEQLPIEVPSNELLSEYGNMRSAISNTLNKALTLFEQMLSDNETIPTQIAKMYVPMICQTFNIRIPISFTDVIYSLDENEFNQIFNKKYPDTLNNIINSKSLLTAIAKMISADGQPIVYNGKTNTIYDQIIYKPLSNYDQKTLYKFAVSSYGKFNSLSGGYYSYNENIIGEPCSNAIAAKIEKIRSPFEASYVIELPIDHIKDLLAHINGINISYMSGMNYNASKDPIINDFYMNGELIPVSSYASRIIEVHNELIALITMMNNDGMVGNSYKYGMLMGASPCRAVIKLHEDKIIQYKNSVKNIMSLEYFMNDITGDFSKLMMDISRKNIKYVE